MVQIWGVQKIVQKRNIKDTKSILLKEASNQGRSVNVEGNSKKVDVNKVKYAMELAVMKKRATKAEQKIAQWKRLVFMAEEQNKSKISTKIIKDLFNSHTSDDAEKCYKLLAKEKGNKYEIFILNTVLHTCKYNILIVLYHTNQMKITEDSLVNLLPVNYSKRK